MRPRSFSAGNTSWRTCPSFSLLICYLRIIVRVSTYLRRIWTAEAGLLNDAAIQSRNFVCKLLSPFKMHAYFAGSVCFTLNIHGSLLTNSLVARLRDHRDQCSTLWF